MANYQDRQIHEECGVFGVFGVEKAASLTYYGLHSLQHRGPGRVRHRERGQPYVPPCQGRGTRDGGLQRRQPPDADGKHGDRTRALLDTGGGGIDNVQPFMFMHSTGDFALAHNGNLVNSFQLKTFLEERGSLFHSTSDSEIFAHLIKKETDSRDRIFPILEALNMVEGAFALLIMTASKIYACRDKHGLRPLSIGKLGDGYVVSSETCAFEVVGAEFIRDVAPGEVVIIDVNGLQSVDYSKFKHYNMCAMEYVYFARPDSDIEGTNVHAFRKETGRMLYEEAPVDADIVVGVPDSSLSAAIGYSEASGIPYEMGLIKNKYVGRTFIQPSQELREKGVRMKLSPVRSIVEGKRLVIVDDSIVRGTTSRRIVKMLRQSGAKEIHMRIASPAITHPCFYGVDMSTYDELICAREKDLEAVRRLIGAIRWYGSRRGALQGGGGGKSCASPALTAVIPRRSTSRYTM